MDTWATSSLSPQIAALRWDDGPSQDAALRVAPGTVVGNPTPGDCHTDQCNSSGGITANVVCPTLTRTPGTEPMFQHAPAIVDGLVARR